MHVFDAKVIQQKFEALFGAAQNEMFKAEVLQDYSAIDDSPSLRAWLAGDKVAARRLGLADQGRIAWRRQCLASPAAITRVHVVEEPLTPYLEWEIEVLYKGSVVPSGAEAVYLAPSAKLRDVVLPTGDFWIYQPEPSWYTWLSYGAERVYDWYRQQLQSRDLQQPLYSG